jgi:hypothetical protein
MIRKLIEGGGDVAGQRIGGIAGEDLAAAE